MFCRQCGTKLADNAAFCTNCGTKTEFAPPKQSQTQVQPQPQPQAYQQPQEQVYQQPQTYQQPLKAKMGKKTQLIIGIASAVVVFAIVLFAVILPSISGGLGASSPEKAVKELMTCLLDGEYEDALNYFPDFYIENADDGGDRAELAKNLESQFGEARSYIDQANMKVKNVELINQYYPDDVEFQDLLRTLTREYSDLPEIEKMAAVNCSIEFSIETPYGDYSDTMDSTGYCAYIGGKWYVIEPPEIGAGGF